MASAAAAAAALSAADVGRTAAAVVAERADEFIVGSVEVDGEANIEIVDPFNPSSDADDGCGDICSVYGPEHLLRLFAKMPKLLAHTSLGDRALELTVKCLNDVLNFLKVNAPQLMPHSVYKEEASGVIIV